MKFNTAKCFVVRFTRSRKPHQYTYTLGDSELKITPAHEYLWVTLTKDLSWKNHTNKITGKANRVLGMIRRNLYPCHWETKIKAYKTLVRPNLEYACTVWDPYQQTLIDQLESVQRRAARFVFNDYSRYSSVTAMLHKLGWEPLSTRRECMRLTMLHKIQRGEVAIKADEYLSPLTRPTRQHNSKAYKQDIPHLDLFKYCFFPRTIKKWNTLPESIVSLNETDSFKAQINELLMPNTN